MKSIDNLLIFVAKVAKLTSSFAREQLSEVWFIVFGTERSNTYRWLTGNFNFTHGLYP
jgi:phage major head subunit gpT-like protein